MVDAGVTFMLVVAAPVFQLYVDAPDAVNVAVAPAQIAALFTVTVKLETTVTVEVFVELQLPVVPVIVYIVVLGGLALTLEPVVALNPVPGLQLYVVAPLAVSVVGDPEQMVDELTFTVGVALTVTVVLTALVHPPVVPVTV